MAGKRGAPKGSRNAAHDKPWTNALERAIAQYKAGDVRMGQALRRIADGVVTRAINGDAAAVKEISERLDGKPIQPIAGKIDTNVTVEVLRFGNDPASE